MISPLTFYQLYLGITLHFNTKRDYDFYKYQGKTRITQDSLDKRAKDKYFFEVWGAKSANEEHAQGIILANVLKGNTYIRHFKMDPFTEWMGYRDGIIYKFKGEMDKYLEAKVTRRRTSDTPLLIECWYSKVVSSEFIILQDIALGGRLFEKYDALEDNMLWDELKKKLNKYRPFILNLWNLDEDILQDIRKIIRNSLTVDAK